MADIEEPIEENAEINWENQKDGIKMMIYRFNTFFPTETAEFRQRVEKKRAEQKAQPFDPDHGYYGSNIRPPSEFPRQDLSKITSLRMSTGSQSIHWREEDTKKLINLRELDLTCDFPWPLDMIHQMKTLTTLSVNLQYEFTPKPLPATPVDLSKLALPPHLSHMSLSMRSNSKYILPECPASIWSTTSLESLCLSIRVLPSFNALPNQVSQLQNLTMLYISPVWFTELPEALFRLVNLKGLTLEPESHWIKPETLDGLRKLTPEIARLTNLETLSLSNNCFTTLPDSIVTMTKLTNISLWDVPLTGLPANFHRLTALSSLGCYIRVVPESVFRLPNHRRFNIYASNKLASNIEALNDLNLVPTTTRSGITYYTRCAGTDISLKHLAASAVVRHKLSTAGLPSDLAELLKIDTFPTAACSQCSRTVSSWIEAYTFEAADITVIFRGCSRTPGHMSQQVGTVPVMYTFCSSACMEKMPKPPKRSFSRSP